MRHVRPASFTVTTGIPRPIQPPEKASRILASKAEAPDGFPHRPASHAQDELEDLNAALSAAFAARYRALSSHP